jgi:hypothetical protein
MTPREGMMEKIGNIETGSVPINGPPEAPRKPIEFTVQDFFDELDEQEANQQEPDPCWLNDDERDDEAVADDWNPPDPDDDEDDEDDEEEEDDEDDEEDPGRRDHSRLGLSCKRCRSDLREH